MAITERAFFIECFVASSTDVFLLHVMRQHEHKNSKSVSTLGVFYTSDIIYLRVPHTLSTTGITITTITIAAATTSFDRATSVGINAFDVVVI